MKSRSLIHRMVGAVLGLELVCAIAFCGTALWHERTSRLRAFDAVLQGRSDSLLGAVQDAEDPADNVVVDPAELKLPNEDVYAVYNQGGERLGGSRSPASVLTQRQGDGYRSANLNGQRYRVLEREALRIIDREENSGIGLRRPVTIVYAAPTQHLWHEIMEAARFYAWVSLVLVGGTALLLIVLIRAFLQPIEDLAGAAGRVMPSSLSFIPPASALRTRELQPLAQAVSALVTRLGVAIEKQHRFVGDAAHELKTAVAVVRSSIQVLGLKPRSIEEYQGGLDGILADNERTEELVARMLTLARFEERYEAPTQALDLAETIDEALQALCPLAAAHEIRLERQFTVGVHTRVAPDAVHTLISNLVVNAVQHSPRGSSVLVSVGFDPQMKEGAVLEVQDHGYGISEKSLPYVFDRFYREDVSRSRETGGAGLGLAICKSIVDAAGGTISLESVPGRGTRVRTTFILA